MNKKHAKPTLDPAFVLIDAHKARTKRYLT
jgi:hypothetical protein